MMVATLEELFLVAPEIARVAVFFAPAAHMVGLA